MNHIRVNVPRVGVGEGERGVQVTADNLIPAGMHDQSLVSVYQCVHVHVAVSTYFISVAQQN